MGFEICMVGMRDCCCCCCVVFRFLAMRQQKIIPERITATPTPAPMPAFAPTERPPESESESEPESESAEFEEEAVVEPVPDPVACAAAEVPVVDEDVTTLPLAVLRVEVCNVDAAELTAVVPSEAVVAGVAAVVVEARLVLVGVSAAAVVVTGVVVVVASEAAVAAVVALVALAVADSAAHCVWAEAWARVTWAVRASPDRPQAWVMQSLMPFW